MPEDSKARELPVLGEPLLHLLTWAICWRNYIQDKHLLDLAQTRPHAQSRLHLPLLAYWEQIKLKHAATTKEVRVLTP